MLCRSLEKNGVVRAWHGRGMASVKQTRSHYVNQMGKTHSKPLAARHCRGTAWARHGYGMLCVNQLLGSRHSAVNTVITQRAGLSGVRLPTGQSIVIFPKTSPGPTQPPFSVGAFDFFFPGVKRPGLEVDQPPPSTAEVKNERS